ncbi:MAG: hypothetical protein LBQ42_14330 [Synergistaceae bacterium]|nr:hypothetical protein [Synergistaceae bacterium]
MAVRKKKKSLVKAANLEIPKDLQDRVQNILERTKLSYQELLQKWLTQEENPIDPICSGDEDFMNMKWKKNVDAQLNDFRRQLSALVGPPAVDLPVPAENEASGKEEYRRTILDKIRVLREQRVTYTDIARQFNSDGVATLSGTGKWYASTISQILSKSKKTAAWI